MILSTTTSVLFKTFGYKRGIELAANIGFDALDFNMSELTESDWQTDLSEGNYVLTCKRLRNMAEKYGIIFNQAHSPFPSYIFDDEDKNKVTRERIIRSIRIAGLLSANQIIIHPIICHDSIDQKQFNVDFYKSLIPYCKEAGIKVAMENLFHYDKIENCMKPCGISFSKELIEYYEELPEKYFTICLDVGHGVLLGEEPQNAIRILGQNRLLALHIHDNDGKSDQHTLPYQGILDWDEIVKALSDIKYMGDFTYEVGGIFLKRYSDKPELLRSAFEMMELTGRELLSKFR